MLSIASIKSALLSGQQPKKEGPPEIDYYGALFSRLQNVEGAPVIPGGDDERNQRIIEAITIRNIFEELRERGLNCMLSLGRSGKYQAIVAGRYSATADRAFEALLSAFQQADKAGALAKK